MVLFVLFFFTFLLALYSSPVCVMPFVSGASFFLKKRKSFFKSGAISNNIKATALPSSIFDWRDSIVRELTVGDIPTQRNVCVELFVCVCISSLPFHWRWCHSTYLKQRRRRWIQWCNGVGRVTRWLIVLAFPWFPKFWSIILSPCCVLIRVKRTTTTQSFYYYYYNDDDHYPRLPHLDTQVPIK